MLKTKSILLAGFTALSLLGCGSGSDTKETKPTPNAKPLVSLSTPSNSISNVDTLVVSSLASDTDGTIVNYEWQISDDKASIVSANASELILDISGFVTDTTLDVQYTATDDDGASQTTTHQIQIDSIGKLAITPRSELSNVPLFSQQELLFDVGFEFDNVTVETDVPGVAINQDQGRYVINAALEALGLSGTITITAFHKEYSLSQSIPIQITSAAPIAPVVGLSTTRPSEGQSIEGVVRTEIPDYDIQWRIVTGEQYVANSQRTDSSAPTFEMGNVSSDSEANVTIQAVIVVGTQRFEYDFDIVVSNNPAPLYTVTGNLALSPGQTTQVAFTPSQPNTAITIAPINNPYVEYTLDGNTLTLSAADFIPQDQTFSVTATATGAFPEDDQLLNLSGSIASNADNVTLSGNISYERVYATPNNGLDLSAVDIIPANGATVLLKDNNGAVLDSTQVDASGAYVLTSPADTLVSVHVTPQFFIGGSYIRVVNALADGVQDNWSQAEYQTPGYEFTVAEQQSYSQSHSELDFVASSQNDGVALGENRTSGAFHLIALSHQAINVTTSLLPNASFSNLEIVWNPASEVASNSTWYLGTTNTAYSDGQYKDRIEVNGQYEVDTDEFDDSVIAHELGHYILNAISRDDSVGGQHFITKPMDARTAFSEGFANFFMYVLTTQEQFVNTMNDSTSSYNILGQTSNDLYAGWFNETANAIVLRSFAENINGVTGSSLNDVFTAVSLMSESESFATVYNFLEQLEQLNNAPSQANAFLAQWGINSISQFAEGETYHVPDALIPDSTLVTDDYLPVYKQTTVGDTLSVCSQATVSGPGNGVGVYHLATLSLATEQSVSFGILNAESDIQIYFHSPDGEADQSVMLSSGESAALTLSAGTHRYTITSPVVAFQGTSESADCFEMTII